MTCSSFDPPVATSTRHNGVLIPKCDLGELVADLAKRAETYEQLLESLVSWQDLGDGWTRAVVDTDALRTARAAFHAPRPELPELAT